MPPTRERSEWSGPGVDGQTASAMTRATSASGTRTGTAQKPQKMACVAHYEAGMRGVSQLARSTFFPSDSGMKLVR